MTRVRVNHRTAVGREDNHRVERNASVTGKRFIFFFPLYDSILSIVGNRSVGNRWPRRSNVPGFASVNRGLNDERSTLVVEKRACARTIDDRVIYVNAIVNAKRGWIFALPSRSFLSLCLFPSREFLAVDESPVGVLYLVRVEPEVNLSNSRVRRFPRRHPKEDDLAISYERRYFEAKD